MTLPPTASPRFGPFAALLAAAVAALAGTSVALSVLQLDSSNSIAAMELLAWWQTALAAWLALSLLALVVRRHGVPRRPNPRASAITILIVAALARGLTLAVTTPTLSDDIWRYIHDGAMLATGHHPYALAPADVVPRHAPAPQVLPHINHPQLVTVYQPASQIFFTVLWRLHQFTGLAPDLAFRIGFAAFDLLVVALILSALRRRDLSPWWAALYAWHPLPITEIAASGHQDALGVAFVLGALVCLDRRTFRAAAGSGVCLAIAVAVKPLALPIALPMLWSLRKPATRRHAVIFLVAVSSVLAVLYLPFALSGPGLAPMFETLSIFARHWAFNGPIHEALARGLGHRTLTHGLLGLVLLVVLLLTLRRGEPWSASLIYFFTALLLSSTAYPWYLLWSFALLPVVWACGQPHPSTLAAVWVWSLTILFSYAVWIHPQPWRPPMAACIAEFAPVYLLLLASAWRSWRRLRLAILNPAG